MQPQPATSPTTITVFCTYWCCYYIPCLRAPTTHPHSTHSQRSIQKGKERSFWVSTTEWILIRHGQWMNTVDFSSLNWKADKVIRWLCAILIICSQLRESSFTWNRNQWVPNPSRQKRISFPSQKCKFCSVRGTPETNIKIIMSLLAGLSQISQTVMVDRWLRRRGLLGASSS